MLDPRFVEGNYDSSTITQFTFYGHSCFAITLPCGTRLLFDPFIRPNELAAHIDVDAIHSSTLPDGSPGGTPGGFIVKTDDVSFYVSGDTALDADQKLLGEMHKLDFTMGPTDAAIAASRVGVKTAVGVQYDTFPPIRIDQAEAKALFDAQGILLHLPAIGETIGL